MSAGTYFVLGCLVCYVATELGFGGSFLIGTIIGVLLAKLQAWRRRRHWSEIE